MLKSITSSPVACVQAISFMALFLITTFPSIAQHDSLFMPGLFQAPIDLILENINETTDETITNIATQTDIPVRETPGIITIISRNEIENSGARDLMELLRLVPGIDFGSDIQNVIGISIRGNWAFEGKVLITMDGQMINETGYGSFAFANRISTESIEKIEIIRGPGSAIYGGVAGLAVINIITKTGRDLQGFSSSHEISFANGKSWQSTNFSIGETFINGLAFNISGGGAESNLSNRSIETFSGKQINYRDSAQISSYFVNAGLQYKNLDIKYFFNEYKSDIIESQGRTVFGGHYLNARYTFPINSKVSIIPQIFFTSHAPWELENVPENNYNTTNTRYTGRIHLLYEPNSMFSLISGIESFYDQSVITTSLTQSVFSTNNEPRLNFYNLALYHQAIFKTKAAHFTLGLRMDDHSTFGIAFVPRMGITKVMDKWHVKLLYSNAFKAPTLQNLAANPKLEPERFNTTEFEIGYQVNTTSSITANFFNVNINNIILYDPVNSIIDYYRNGENSGSRGAEVYYFGRYGKGSLKANYSFYFSHPNESDKVYSNGHPSLVAGFPAHKIILQPDLKITRVFSVYSSLLFFSNRITYFPNEDQGSETVILNPSLVSNIFIRYKNLLFNGLDINIGIKNLFDSKNYFIHVNQINENPIPFQQREFTAKVLFAFGN